MTNDNFCIFVNKPESCSICLESGKLQCLLNHTHLKVSKAGKSNLREILKDECTTPRRYKDKSGLAGRLV